MSEPLFQAIRSDPQTLRLVGELDMSTVPLLDAAMESVTSNGTVTLDLSGLSFIDSHGLHAIARYTRDLDGHRPLVLTNVPAGLLRLFEFVGFAEHAAIEIR